MTEQWQYFSKWENKWVDFKLPPNDRHKAELKKFKYLLRIKPEENDIHKTTAKKI